MILVTQHKTFDWVTLLYALKKAGPFVVVFGIGGWTNSIINHAADLPYLKRATHELQQVQKVAGPDPVSTVKCLRKSTQVAKETAGQAVIALTNEAVAAPSLDRIPNCPPPPVAKSSDMALK